jgi:hypothetical protein
MTNSFTAKESAMRLFVEGWRFLPHSYAMVNQFQLLELRRHADVELYHRDMPYYAAHWPVVNGLFDPEREAALRSLPTPPADELPDATLRLYVPFNFLPAPAGRTLVWCTTEWGTADSPKTMAIRSHFQRANQPLFAKTLIASSWRRT